MKRSLLVLFAFAVLFLSGCTDQTQSPVSPADNSYLAKFTLTNFTALTYPTGVTDPGKVIMADGNLILRNMAGTLAALSDNILVNATGVIVYNFNIDAVTGEGHHWGTIVMTPPEAGGGVWELTWRGYSRHTGEIWTLTLKLVGHGRGGNIDGIQLLGENIITYNTPVPFIWTGNLTGILKLFNN